MRLDVPAGTAPGVPTKVTVRLTNLRTGDPITDLGRSHEVWMHLIATRADLGTFAHVHPAPTGHAGELSVEMTFPTAGRYVINTESRRGDQMGDLHDRQVVTIAGTAPTATQLSDSRTTQVVNGVRVDLASELRAGEESELRFIFHDAATGAPLHDLKPYLAAAGHVVIMRADGATFTHEHADVRDSNGKPVFALPGRTFGPALPVHAHFDTAGTYRLWGRFRLADDRVITVPFSVTVP